MGHLKIDQITFFKGDVTNDGHILIGIGYQHIKVISKPGRIWL